MSKPKQYTLNGTVLTDETIKKTCKYFEEIELGCIAEVKSGEVRVNDPEGYFEWRMDNAEKYRAGIFDVSFTFLQAAYWIQTGETIPLLPKTSKQ